MILPKNILILRFINFISNYNSQQNETLFLITDIRKYVSLTLNPNLVTGIAFEFWVSYDNM